MEKNVIVVASVLTWYKKKRLISYVKAWILRAPSMVVGNTKKLNNFPRH